MIRVPWKKQAMGKSTMALVELVDPVDLAGLPPPSEGNLEGMAALFDDVSKTVKNVFTFPIS